MRLRRIEKIIESAQLNRATHPKYLKELEATFYKTDFDEFFNNFTMILLRLFTRDTKVKDPFANRIMEFLSKFCISLPDETKEFLLKLIEHILKYHNSVSHNVRYRVCEFIKMLLKGLDDEEDIDDAVYDDISIAMQERIIDIKPNVRVQAAFALQRLQDPLDAEDPVVNTYFKALSVESHAHIRKAIVQCIGMTSITIPVLMKRCLDKDDSVRLAAFEKFYSLPKQLKLEQRQFILRNGLRSKNNTIKRYVTEKLLSRWLDIYKGDYVNFLQAIKLDANEKEMDQSVELCENVLDAFFRTKTMKENLDGLPKNEDKLISLTQLTFETSLYWRCLADYLHTNKQDIGDEYVDLVIPDLPQFVQYVDDFYKMIKNPKTERDNRNNNYILSQLLKIILIYDMMDEKGRKDTHTLVVNILNDALISYPNILLLTKILEKIIPKVEERSTELCFIISNIREPLVHSVPTKEQTTKRDLKLAPLRVKINIMSEELETAVNDQKFQVAEELKNKIAVARKEMQNIIEESEALTSSVRVAKNDAHTVLKCLDILIALLHSTQIEELTGALRTIMEQFVKPLVLLGDPSIHCRVLKCYALFCIMDKNEATDSLQLFCTQLLAYRYNGKFDMATTIVCTEAVIAFLMLHGAKIFGDDPVLECSTFPKKKCLYDDSQLDTSLPNLPTSASITDIIEIISNMLDDPELEIRELAGVSLIKLISNNIIRSPSLLSKLILKWFNPATAKDVKLRQMLGIFFPEYIMRVPGSLAIVEQAFLPTLTAIVRAPPNSPLIDVDVDAMLKFLVELSRPHLNKPDKGLETHKNLALQLCNEICNKSVDSKCTHIFLRALLFLDPPVDDIVIMEDLKKQAALMNEQISEKLHKKLVMKYIEKLNGLEMTNNNGHITNDQTDMTNQIDSTNQVDSTNQIDPTNQTELTNHTIDPTTNRLSNSVSVKRKRSGSIRQNIDNRNGGNRTVLNSILEHTSENGSIADDDMTIDTPSSGSNCALEPSDFEKLTLTKTDSESDEEKLVEPTKLRRSLRKSARRK